jgi:hypothetical protein
MDQPKGGAGPLFVPRGDLVWNLVWFPKNSDRVFPIKNAGLNEGDGARTRNHRIDSPVL